MNFQIRKAEKKDIPDILDLIKELAEFEKALDEVTVTEEQLEKDGFSDNAVFKVILAENEEGALGMAFYFYSYSTWKGKCLYLEDIIVKDGYRGKGIGEKLFNSVVMEAKTIGAKRMQWQVLDWNDLAISFYESKYNAILDSSWVNCKLTDVQLKKMKI